MDHFAYRDGVMHAEDVPLPLIAETVGTPVYVYSRATLERHARVFREALADVPDKLIAFAVKSNPNLAVLKVLLQHPRQPPHLPHRPLPLRRLHRRLRWRWPNQQPLPSQQRPPPRMPPPTSSACRVKCSISS